ncbi:MAG: hypothetical protein ACR2KB_06425 [Chitinophagaceae bacterium]
MEHKVVISYGGGLAHYVIIPEHEGIFQAHLLRYDGRPDHAPQAKLTLIKGKDNWSGNSDRKDVIEQIGKILDQKKISSITLNPSNSEAARISR